MDKNQITNILEEVAGLLELKEGSNPFEGRAYQNAARAISALDGDIEQLTRENYHQTHRRTCQYRAYSLL